MQTMNPAPNNIAQAILWRNGSFNFNTTGMGMRMTQKSVAVLIIPPARRWALSLKQFWGAKDSVQYSDTGLNSC
jgi:hypothetical protein